jgi:hypothetical protein
MEGFYGHGKVPLCSTNEDKFLTGIFCVMVLGGFKLKLNKKILARCRRMTTQTHAQKLLYK